MATYIHDSKIKCEGQRQAGGYTQLDDTWMEPMPYNSLFYLDYKYIGNPYPDIKQNGLGTVKSSCKKCAKHGDCGHYDHNQDECVKRYTTETKTGAACLSTNDSVRCPRLQCLWDGGRQHGLNPCHTTGTDYKCNPSCPPIPSPEG
jgi:hypothetical protein